MLIAHYPLNGDTLDYCNNYHATNNGATINDNGKIGKCYSFDGVSNYLALPSSLPFKKLANCSISFWRKNVNSNPWLLFQGQNGSYYLLATGGASGFYHNNIGNNNKIYMDNQLVGQPSVDGQWHHYVITGVDLSNWTALSLSNYSGYQYNGFLNDLRIYDHVLSEKEIRELSKAKILHYTFNDLQEPTENFIPNGCFNGGLGITSESGSNPTNTIVALNNPGDSDWVLMQYGATTEYEIHFKAGTQIQPNTTYCMSCWVAYTADWDGGSQLFHARWYDGVGTSIASNGSGTLIESKVVDGLTWEYRYLTFTTPATVDGRFNWYLGYAAGNTLGYRYITNVQLEAKSYPTPFVCGLRGGKVRDISGYRNHADLSAVNTPKWCSGSALGKGCYDFNGSTQYIPTTLKYKHLESFTISLWVYMKSFKSFGVIAGTQFGNNLDAGLLAVGSYLNFHDYSTDNNDRNPIIVDILKLNEWQHIVSTYNKGSMVLYYNGVQIGTATMVLGGSTANTFMINSIFQNSGVYRGADCQIDDVKIYATALSAGDALELYQTRGQLDNKGNLFINSINESSTNSSQISDRGIANMKVFSEIGIAEGLIGWWKLDGDVKDSCGIRHGTVYGTLTSVTGILGTAYTFNGTNSYVKMLMSALGAGIPFTMSCWFKTSVSFAYQPGIMSLGYSPVFVMQTGGTVRAWWYDGTTYPGLASTKVCNDGVYHHMVLTYDGTTAKLYIDGAFDKSMNSSIRSIYSDIYIGLEMNAGNKIFNGDIDEVRLYNRDLTAEEVNILYKLGNPNVGMQMTKEGTLFVNSIREV